LGLPTAGGPIGGSVERIDDHPEAERVGFDLENQSISLWFPPRGPLPGVDLQNPGSSSSTRSSQRIFLIADERESNHNISADAPNGIEQILFFVRFVQLLKRLIDS
jgi:hypothetical protein